MLMKAIATSNWGSCGTVLQIYAEQASHLFCLPNRKLSPPDVECWSETQGVVD